MRKARTARVKGVTLVELMIGMVVLTTAFVSVALVFTSISKGILVNKTKTLAVNLAQEKIESLKNLSYFRLLVTTSVAPADPNFPNATGMYYDNGTTRSYYPEETLIVGDITFKRRAFVEYLRQVGNDFIGYPSVTWTSNDTGIKRVTVYVVWQEGEEWKKIELSNLRNNPDRAQLEYEFRGVVSSATSGTPLVNALVDTEQNPSYFARTDSDGIYYFKVQPGTYTLRATATGYFVEISTPFFVNVDAAGTLTKNFSMVKKATGTAVGWAFLRNNIQITQVVADYDSGANTGQEWVELYNPSTYSVLIASKSAGSSNYDIFFVTVSYIENSNADPGTGNSKTIMGDPSGPGSEFTAFRSTSLYWNTSLSSHAIYIPARSYFLISNYSTITVHGNFYRIADAYYSGGDGGNSINSIGGIRVIGHMGYNFNERTDWHDGLGWGVNSIIKAIEGSNGTNTNFLNSGSIFYRLHYKNAITDCFTAQTHSFRTTSPYYANNFDSESSGSACPGTADFDWDSIGGDYLKNDASLDKALSNADTSMIPYSGRSAVGASVSSNDGRSAVAYVQRYSSFTIMDIDTGTWNVTISTGGFTRFISSMTVIPFPPNASTQAVHGGTDPMWEYVSFPAVALTSSTDYGYISGTVRNALQQPLGGVTIEAPGAASVTTNAQGRYRINVEPIAGDVLVMASKTAYTTETSVVSGVALGLETSGIDFTLVSASSYKGFITTNGGASGYLPGIPVIATDESSTTIFGQAISDVQGFYIINSISTGNYIISPQLESGETSDPGVIMQSITVTPQVRWSTFTIANAFGDISGRVSLGDTSHPITAGVLLVASPVAVDTAGPPDVNEGIRNGTTIYYSVSSDASGRYTIPVRGNAPYYLYGWYTSFSGVDTSSSSKRSPLGVMPFTVDPGVSVSKDITW